ncbi:MAG: vitamin K epoxide reductase family protein [Bacteriovorax sp.]|nr:vitamin K epoxide reductase family protein [Bacteriovorax sp.]
MLKTTIYQDKKLKTSIILFILSALMIGFSVYLTQHYFDLKFPTGLESKSLCNVNQFFNCDKTTLSLFGNILGVPLALFGVMIGLLVMVGLIVKNENYERTIYFTLAVNFIGCIVLFSYSLFVLKGLCPFCTLYYIVSGIIYLFFIRKSRTIIPAPGYLALFAVIVIVISGFTKMDIDSKAKAQSDVAGDLIKQYYSLPNLGNPKVISEFKIATAENAPIRMVIFSDFECPACKGLSELMPLIASRYNGKIDIQYFFYPLDNSCNPSMQRPLHQYACKASYVASCMPKQDFAKVHDEIFQNQDKFEAGFLDQYIKTNKLETCVADPKTKEKVVSLITAADPFNIRSTPSYLINGVKIEGGLPADQMYAIMDEILRRAGK